MKSSLLKTAAIAGHLETVRLLVDSGFKFVCDLGLSKPSDDQTGPLHYLIMFEEGHIQEACQLLKIAGCDINAVFPNKAGIGFQYRPEIHMFGTPLHFAIAYGRLDIVKTLLEEGADINHTGGFVWNHPVACAVFHYQPEILCFLLAQDGLAALDSSPFLRLACRTPFKRLLTHGPRREAITNQIIDILLQHGFDPLQRIHYVDETKTATTEMWVTDYILQMELAIDDFSNAFELLSDRGVPHNQSIHFLADVISRQPPGPQGALAEYLWHRILSQTPQIPDEPHILHLLAIREAEDAARRILELGAPPDPVYQLPMMGSTTPLVLSVYKMPDPGFARALLEHGANVNCQIYPDAEKLWDSPLGFALGSSSPSGEVIDLLLDGGATVVKDSGETVVHHVVHFRSSIEGQHMLRHLLRRDNEGKPRHPQLVPAINAFWKVDSSYPLILAIKKLNIDALYALFDAGADLDILPEHGLSLLKHLKSHAIESHFPEDFSFTDFEGRQEIQEGILQLAAQIAERL
jgi:hypothetical protein